MELRFELFTGARAKSCFDESARFLAFAANEAVRLHAALSIGCNDDFNRFQETPPTLTVSLMAPSSSNCSVTEWPFLRASSVARSTA